MSVKNWLNQDYGGRYVSCVLQELLSAEPKIVQAVFGKKVKYEVIKREESLRKYWPYLKNTRRADIALIDSNGNVSALVEVKYEDQKNDRNHAQISDYIKFCNKYKHEEIPFVVITKSVLPKAEEKLLSDNGNFAKSFSYGDIARIILANNSDSHVAKMVKEYFEEEALMFKAVDKDSLMLLMINSLHICQNHGLHKQRSHKTILNAPRVLESLISNTGLIGDHIRHTYMPDNKFPKRPTPNFYFSPKILDSHVSRAQKDLDNEREISKERIFAGKFYTYYEFPLKDENNYWKGWFDFGFYADLNTKNKIEPLKTFLYAEIGHRSKNIDDSEYDGYAQKEINIERITEAKAIEILCSLLKCVIKESLNKLQLSRGVRATLNAIHKNISRDV
jgi:hypothetical protein